MGMKEFTEGLSVSKDALDVFKKYRKELQVKNLISIRQLGILDQAHNEKVDSILTRYVDSFKG